MSSEQKLRQHIYTYSKKMSSEVGELLNMKFEPDAMDLIAELAYKKLSLYGADLEAFQKHAKRSSVTVDDVKLLVRRNESLKNLVNEKIQFLLENRPVDLEPPAKRKKKTGSTGGAESKT